MCTFKTSPCLPAPRTSCRCHLFARFSRRIAVWNAFHDVRRKKPLTLHNGFMFFASRSCFKQIYNFQATSLSNIYCVIMSHQERNNIRNGIVWVQSGQSTCTCTVTLHVIEPRTHQKFESSEKNNVRNDENRIRICYLCPKTPEIVRNYFRSNGILLHLQIVPLVQLKFHVLISYDFTQPRAPLTTTLVSC